MARFFQSRVKSEKAELGTTGTVGQRTEQSVTDTGASQNLSSLSVEELRELIRQA